MSRIVERIDSLFNPQSIAFIGASKKPGKWGFIIFLHLLMSSYNGKVYPVNPNEKEVLGVPSYPSLDDIPYDVDLAYVTIPQDKVIDIMQECIKKGVKAVILIAAGFGEIAEENKELEKEIASIAERGNLVVMGPNCNGIVSASCGLCALMPAFFPKKGHIAVVSQSGNIGNSILVRGMEHNIGFSRYISSGNESHLCSEDYIEYYGEDDETKVITAYIEGIKDGRKFFEVAKRVTKKKPIILLKGGTTAFGASAAKSHTGSMAGSAEVFASMCRQAGIIGVNNLDEMFDIASSFLCQPLPKGNNVGIVTGGGGWGVVVSDACAREGLNLPDLEPETISALDQILPSWWNKGNPIDTVAGQNRAAFIDAMEILIKSDYIDSAIGLGIGFSAMTGDAYSTSKFRSQFKELDMPGHSASQDLKTAEKIIKLKNEYKKPILLATDAAVMAKSHEHSVFKMYEDEGIIVFPTPDRATRVLAKLTHYKNYLQDS
ncbi:MAG: CoA-binding protein [Thermodesulfobacteriota bacterium]|nr:CoA-binding protein [Thermodesulfobacteriota bacterium]